MPRISVLLPIYNAQAYLDEAVESLLKQSFRDFEIIAVDDGSTDKSLEILQNLARVDQRLRVVSRPNTGYTQALSDAVQLAEGEYFARMDADDISMPTRFEKQVEYLDARPGVAACGARILVVDPDGDAIYEACKHEHHEEIERHHFEQMNSAIAHPAAMIRRTAFEAVGGYRPEFEPAEDFDLWLRLGEIGRLANLPQVLLHYRIHEKSVSRTREVEQVQKSRRAVVAAAERRGWPVRSICAPTLPKFRRPLRYCWTMQALKSGHRQDAAKLAFKHLRLSPFSPWAWKALFSLFFKGCHFQQPP